MHVLRESSMKIRVARSWKIFVSDDGSVSEPDVDQDIDAGPLEHDREYIKLLLRQGQIENP